MCTSLVEIEENGKSVYLLNHNLIIQNAYLEQCEDEIFCYKLKEQIFRFTKKKKSAEKRKIAGTSSETTDKENELNNISIVLNKVLEKQDLLKRCFGTISNGSPDLELNVDENYSLHRSYGDNMFNTLKVIEILDSKYIIPGKSRYYNMRVDEFCKIIIDETFDFIIIDPPWRNKYIRRLRKSEFKKKFAYEMMSHLEIENIPVEKFTAKNSIVIIWCTNSQQHQEAILNHFLPKWNLKFLTKFFWIKLSSNCGKFELHHDLNSESGKKQPFEVLFVASPMDSELNTLENNSNFLLSVPSAIHSHKPPLLELFKKWLPKDREPNCLELFARYLQPGFTSVGTEVLKLMNINLYDREKVESPSVK
ncbi:N(6)-adenine-specific methyltransferase METTL4 [Condylostylus longicornis]|uniref:N(6)-adenine-specific methyltransferase METTL4 n=1 Tax=Condylostylus longicornis TaxID=2530218 RepID=UPI00244DF465|nr:N(6)-adenine-specific methyltransferase METTL4 [Condylostylus longicornis]